MDKLYKRTKMEKLQLKHLAPYLPYGLKINCTHPKRDYEEMTLCDKKGLSNITIDSVIDTPSIYSPILRPLSQLTEEIKHNGERFVPSHVFDSDEAEYGFTEDSGFDYIVDFIYHIDSEFWPYAMVEQLFKWHFDVFGLIEKGLAIEKTN